MEKFIDDLERLLKLRKAADEETKPLIDKAIEALIAEHVPQHSITITPPAPSCPSYPPSYPSCPLPPPEPTPYRYSIVWC